MHFHPLVYGILLSAKSTRTTTRTNNETTSSTFGFLIGHTYTGGHRAGDTLRILSDNNFLRITAGLTPNFPPFFDFFGNGLGMVGLELPKSLKTRFCPLGHFVTDFGHGAGNGTGGRIGFPSQ